MIVLGGWRFLMSEVPLYRSRGGPTSRDSLGNGNGLVNGFPALMKFSSGLINRRPITNKTVARLNTRGGPDSQPSSTRNLAPKNLVPETLSSCNRLYLRIANVTV